MFKKLKKWVSIRVLAYKLIKSKKLSIKDHQLLFNETSTVNALLIQYLKIKENLWK